MVSSALYRYYPSRDELLTALIVDAYDAIGAAAEAARRHRSDVVLLEGDKLRSEAARNAAAIEALNPHARVIVIVDKQPTEWPGLDTLPKWVELDAVVDTLETGTNGLPHPDPDAAA
jgi:AcrR family transcriptional regulator